MNSDFRNDNKFEFNGGIKASMEIKEYIEQ